MDNSQNSYRNVEKTGKIKKIFSVHCADVHVNGKSEAKCRTYLKLIDANSGEDIDIGEEMIQRGHAAVTTAAEK